MSHARHLGTVIEGLVNLVAYVEQDHAGPTAQRVAVCLDCKPVLPMPFGADGEESDTRRDEWTRVHEEATRHRVVHPERLGADLGRLSTDGRLVL